MKTLNMTGGEALTLEKAVDRMEFEALPLMVTKGCIVDDTCTCKSGTYTVSD
jgi:hypothetical protein